MNGLHNLKYVVYEAVISPKEYIKDKNNLYWNFIGEIEINI